MATPTPTGQGSINQIGPGSVPNRIICAPDLQFPGVHHTLFFVHPLIHIKELCTGERYDYQRFYTFGLYQYAPICAKLNAGQTVYLFGEVMTGPFLKPTGWM